MGPPRFPIKPKLAASPRVFRTFRFPPRPSSICQGIRLSAATVDTTLDFNFSSFAAPRDSRCFSSRLGRPASRISGAAIIIPSRPFSETGLHHLSG